jgi:hypothetical protein
MHIKIRKLGASAAAVAAALSLGLAGCTTPSPGPGPITPGPVPGPVDPGPGGTQKGPNPTSAMLEARSGPFNVATARVSGAQASGFGGGTIHYPTDQSLGRMGLVAVVPGFMSAESSIRWYGPRIASHGFVVITIDTNTPADQPASRGRQLNSALQAAIRHSSVSNRIDSSRQAVVGWSMGGGGTLDAAASNNNIKAIVPLAPWHTNTSRRNLRTPALVISCSTDAIAPNAMHSTPIYNNLGSTEKAAFTASGSHFCVTNTPDAGIGKMTVAWIKRFVDNDTRYSSIICEGPGRGYSGWKSTCPM